MNSLVLFMYTPRNYMGSRTWARVDYPVYPHCTTSKIPWNLHLGNEPMISIQCDHRSVDHDHIGNLIMHANSEFLLVL